MHTNRSPAHANQCCHGTIQCFLASSCRHNGLEGGRYRLWRGFCSASREWEGRWDMGVRGWARIQGWDGVQTNWGGEGEEEEGTGEVADRSVLGGPLLPSPMSLVHARNPGDGKIIRSTSVYIAPVKQSIVHLMRVLVSQPSLVLSTKYEAAWTNVWFVPCGDAWLRVVVLEGQAAVVITHCGLGWVRRMCGLGFGRRLLDELVLLFLVIKTGILDRRIGWK